MVVVSLNGGLGNQMFQYALGRHLAIKHKTSLYYTFNSPKGDTQRLYSLGCFPVNLKSLSLTNLLIAKFRLKPIKEKTHNFSPDILNSPDNIWITGYWQSEKYFQSISGILRDDFTFIYPPDKSNQIMLKKIMSTASVAVHIRHGDYLTRPETQAFHGLLPVSYYRQAFRIIQKRLRKPVFYFFSDDIAWCRANFSNLAQAEFIDHNLLNGKDWPDLRLMSRCRHQIIANSSFSWWGAWLNPGKNKLVIAPKKWFGSESLNISDRLPASWIKL